MSYGLWVISDSEVISHISRFTLHAIGGEYIRSSHHIFRKEGVEEKINLQKEGKNAKLYELAPSPFPLPSGERIKACPALDAGVRGKRKFRYFKLNKFEILSRNMD